MRFGVPHHCLKRLLAAENKLVVRKGRGEHPHPVLFKKLGVLERAARGTMKDRNIHLEIACSIQGGHNRTRAGCMNRAAGIIFISMS